MSGACLSFAIQKDRFFDMAHVCASIVVYSVRNPGGLTNMYSDNEISLYKLKNMLEHDKNMLVSVYRGLLETAIKKYFDGVSVEVTSEDIDTNIGTYKIIIKITYNGSPVITFDQIKLNDDGKFSIVF